MSNNNYKNIEFPQGIKEPIYFFSESGETAIYTSTSHLSSAWINYYFSNEKIDSIYDGNYRLLTFKEEMQSKKILGFIPSSKRVSVFSFIDDSNNQDEVREKLISFLESRKEPIVDSDIIGMHNLDYDSNFNAIYQRALDYAIIYP